MGCIIFAERKEKNNRKHGQLDMVIFDLAAAAPEVNVEWAFCCINGGRTQCANLFQTGRLRLPLISANIWRYICVECTCLIRPSQMKKLTLFMNPGERFERHAGMGRCALCLATSMPVGACALTKMTQPSSEKTRCPTDPYEETRCCNGVPFMTWRCRILPDALIRLLLGRTKMGAQ